MTTHHYVGAGRLCGSCGTTLNAPVHSVPSEMFEALVLEDHRDAAMFKVRRAYLVAAGHDGPVTVAERCWDAQVCAFARVARVAIQAIPERGVR
jgi:hypothetical protein